MTRNVLTQGKIESIRKESENGEITLGRAADIIDSLLDTCDYLGEELKQAKSDVDRERQRATANSKDLAKTQDLLLDKSNEVNRLEKEIKKYEKYRPNKIRFFNSDSPSSVRWIDEAGDFWVATKLQKRPFKWKALSRNGFTFENFTRYGEITYGEALNELGCVVDEPRGTDQHEDSKYGLSSTEAVDYMETCELSKAVMEEILDWSGVYFNREIDKWEGRCPITNHVKTIGKSVLTWHTVEKVHHELVYRGLFTRMYSHPNNKFSVEIVDKNKNLIAATDWDPSLTYSTLRTALKAVRTQLQSR